MRTVVIYESMYGNTHLIARAVGTGLSSRGPVTVVPVGEAKPELLADADLLVVGGPTHIHGMSRPTSRKSAADAAHKPDSPLVLEPDAEGEGLREFFASLESVHAKAAAFDTRLDGPAAFTGRASKGISRSLAHHGLELIIEPESFLVGKASHLEAGEEARAQQWGERLGAVAAGSS
jgi:hypothetical protein